MKKTIHKIQVFLISSALILTLAIALPSNVLSVIAAPLEDCDLDGYDDATGVPVPWPGYDETKGDTPNGSGSTNTGSGGSTSSGSTGSTNSNNSGSTNSGSNGTTSSGSNAASSGGTTGSSGGSTPSSGSTGKTSSTDTGSSTSTESDEQSVSNEQASSGAVDSNSESESLASEDTESVINTKGSLKITEANGSIVHAGSSIVIAGSGFSGNTDDFEIEIHSKPQYLGKASSSEDGSFELQAKIPENLEEGTHDIVVLYQGKEIMRQQIEVGPKAADSFWEALSVGFSADNEGLIPGLLILAGLVIVSSAALLANRFTRIKVKSE